MFLFFPFHVSENCSFQRHGNLLKMKRKKNCSTKICSK